MNLKIIAKKKEEALVSSLVKLASLSRCRIDIDYGYVNITIKDIEEDDVKRVKEMLSESFNIIKEETVNEEEISAMLTEEDLEFKRIKFENLFVEKELNKLIRTAYWAIYSEKASVKDICRFIVSTSVEIAMKYMPKPVSEYSVGDIVDCNFGNHLVGEISGGHVQAIVCDIDSWMTYVLPITRETYWDSDEFLTFLPNIDVMYEEKKYVGGTILLKKGRYINEQRIGEVLGKATPKFFHKVLNSMPDYSEVFFFKYLDRMLDF